MTRHRFPQPIRSTQRWAGAIRHTLGLSVAALAVLSVGLGSLPITAEATARAADGRAVPAAGRTPAKRTSNCPQTYTVVNGDFWVGIAKKLGLTTSALLQANNAASSAPLYPGDVLCVPTGGTTSTTTTTTTPASPTTTTPSTGTTVPGAPAPVVPLGAFPVQGPCWFTDTWMAPRSGGRLHEGVDIIARSGQYVYAVVAGTLSRQVLDKPGSLSGNGWWLTAPDGAYYFYAHLSAFAPDLTVGSTVAAGQIIGYVGATGNAAGPHLHFEVHPTGAAPIDPTPTIKAVDGCKNREALPQPSGTVPAAPAPPPASTTTVPGATTLPPTNTAPVPSGVPGGDGVPPASGVLTDGALWQFISPVSAYDTAATGRSVGAGKTITVPIGSLKGVSATTSGVMVRLTSRGAAAAGYVVVHACDASPPAAASLSFPAKGNVVATAIVRVTNASFCFTSNVSAGIKVEVIAMRSATGVGLHAVSATRALDTRTTKRLQPGAQVAIDATKLGVVPGTQALTATITIVSPASSGTFAIGFCGAGLWSVPMSSAAVSSFSITMRVTGSGWCVASSVATDVVVDVTGIWTSGPASPSPLTPARIFDSRSSTGPIGTTPVAVQVAGVAGAPGDASTALLSITTVTGASPGVVFVGPCGASRPDGAIAATSPKRSVTAMVAVPLGSGAVCVSAMQPVDVIIDLVGAG